MHSSHRCYLLRVTYCRHWPLQAAVNYWQRCEEIIFSLIPNRQELSKPERVFFLAMEGSYSKLPDHSANCTAVWRIPVNSLILGKVFGLSGMIINDVVLPRIKPTTCVWVEWVTFTPFTLMIISPHCSPARHAAPPAMKTILIVRK